MNCVGTTAVGAPSAATRIGAELALVCFSSEAFVGCVRNALLASGYCVRLVDQRRRSQLRAMKCPELVVLLVGDSPDYYKNARALLYQLSEVPVFVVFQAGVPEGHEYLIQQCMDFSVWPCTDSELRQRLNRLDAGGRGLTRLAQAGPVAERLAVLNMVGESSLFRECCKQMKKFSGCAAPVLIEGETGTGKDVMARAIHDQSEGRNGPFVPVNCGALPDSLFENEVFGHEQGAYTGAGKRYGGLVGQAQGGTLFLDEVDALSMKGQVALLRFLEDRRYRPLGGTA